MHWNYHRRIDIPNRVIAPLNGLKHVLDHIVRVLSSNSGGLFTAKILYALSRFNVNFRIFERAILSITPVNKGFSACKPSLTALVNLYVCPLYEFMWRTDLGVPRSLNRTISWWMPSGLPTWKLNWIRFCFTNWSSTERHTPRTAFPIRFYLSLI